MKPGITLPIGDSALELECSNALGRRFDSYQAHRAPTRRSDRGGADDDRRGLRGRELVRVDDHVVVSGLLVRDVVETREVVSASTVGLGHLAARRIWTGVRLASH